MSYVAGALRKSKVKIMSKMSKEMRKVLLGLASIVLIASLPLLVDYQLKSDELAIHIAKMEVLADRICQGELPEGMEAIGMWENEQNEFIFCGNVCLMFPAVLKIMGLHTDSACRIFLIAVNLVTAVIAYISFSKGFESRSVGMFGCVLYTLAPYRLYIMYNRMDAGEFTAMIFLPLLVWGFYRVYMGDAGKKAYLWNGVILATGFSGLLQSHLVLFGMAVFFAAILCLILWKKTFRRRTLMLLCCTVIMTVLINAWYLISCMDAAVSRQYVFKGELPVLIQERGIFPAHIFYTLQAGGASSQFAQYGMVDTAPVGMGTALLLCVFLWLVLYARSGGTVLTEEQRKERKAGNMVLVLDGVALIMSTYYFPWDFLSTCSQRLGVLIGLLYSPARITVMVTILSVSVACVMGVRMLREGVGFMSGRTVLFLIAMVSVLFGNYQLNDILMTSEKFQEVAFYISVLRG